MAKYSNTVEYQIRTTLDSSGIAKLKAELATLQQTLITNNAKGIIPEGAFKQTLSDIKQVEMALSKAFNGKLGMLDLKKFNSELTAGGRTLNDYYKSFSNLGSQGTRAFGQMYGQLTKIDTGMKQVSSTTDKIANTFGNTFRWGIIASMFSGIMNTFHESVQYVKDLDNSLTQIMMVSGIARENMNQFAVQANEAAKMLGGTTVQMTEATKVFIQQGFDLQQSTQLGEYAVHLANVSEQDSATASDEITAYMNAFKIPLEDLGNAISKWAAVANATAVDVEELSIASQKAASVAATVGVDLDQFAGHIAAIESVTREAPENIGNGLKTIYSRIADVSLGETLEDGVNLGSFAKALEKVGVDVLDQTGKLRDAGVILEDLMVVWQDLDQTQRAAVAKTVAGRFQLARFEALMNRADIYENAANISRVETGTDTYDRMQETYKTSMEGRLNTLTATIEGIFVKAFNTDDFYSLIDAAQALADTFDNLVQAIGGGDAALTALGAVLTKVFSKNIAQGIGNSFLNRETNQLARSNMNVAISNAKQTAVQGGAGLDSKYLNDMTLNIANVQKNMGSFSQEQLDQFNTKAQKHIQIMTEAAIAEKEFSSSLEAAETLIKSTGISLSENTSLQERYAQVLRKVVEAEADGVPFIAAEDEMYKALMSDIEQLNRGLVRLSQDFEKVAESGRITDNQMKNLKQNARMLNLATKELAENEALSQERKQQLWRTSKVLSQIEQGEITNQTKLAQAINRAGLEAKEFYASLGSLAKEGIDVSSVIKKMGVDFQQLSSYAAVSTQEMKGAAQAASAQSFANGVANLASGIMSVVFAAQSVQSAFAAMSDENLDPFEKLEQGLMGFSMAAAMTLPMIINMGKSFAQYNKVLAASTLQQAANNMVNSKAKSIIGAVTGMKMIDITLTKESTSEERKAFITEKLFANGKKEVKRSTVAAIAALTGQKAAVIEAEIAEAGGTVVTRSFAVAFKELAVSIWTALAPMLPFIAAAAAIAVMIGGIVLAVKNAHDQYYRFDIALDKAKESLTRANEELDVAKDRVEALNESLEKVNNIDDTFDNLNRGTAEWNQALIEANQNVLDLLATYPELAEYVERGQYGELTINKQGQEVVRDKTQLQLEGAQVNASRAQNEVFEAERNKYRMDFIHDNAQFIENQNTKTYFTGTPGGVSYSDDTAILGAMKEIESLWAASGYNNEKFAQALQETGKYTEEQIAALVENSDKITDLSASVEQNTLAQQVSNEARAAQLMSDNDIYQRMDASAQHVVDVEVARRMNDKSEGSLYSEGAAEFETNYKDKDAAVRRALEMGIFGEGTEYSNGKWFDAEGQEIERLNNLTDSQLYEEIKEAHIGLYIAESIQQDSDAIARPIEQAFIDATFAGGEEFANIFAGNGGFDTKGVADFVRSGPEILENLDLSKVTEADWKELGFNSAEDFVNALNSYLQENPVKLNIEIPTDTTVDFGEEEISSLLDDTGISENAFDRMSKTFYDEEGGYFQNALSELPAQIQEAESELSEIGHRTEENAKDYDEAENKVRALTDEYANLEEESRDVAAASVRLHKGLTKLTDSWEDLSDVLSNEASKGTVEYYEALGELDEIMSDLVNIDVGTLSDDFYQGEEAAEHLAAIERAANGDMAAIDELRNYAAQDIIQHMEIQAVDGASIDEARAELLALQQSLQAELDATPLEARATVDTHEYTEKLNEMIMAGQITAEQASNALSSMGITATMTTEKGTVSVPKVSYRMIGSPEDLVNGGEIKIEPYPDGTMEQEVDIPQFVGDHYSGSGITYVGGGGKSGGSGSKSGGGSKGGGGGSGKSYEPKKKDYTAKEKDRYEKVNTALDEIDSSIQNITMDQDRLVGSRALNNLEKETKLLKEQIPWYQEKLNIQKQEAEELKKQLKDGYGAQFGANGQLQNYSNIFDQLEKERKAAYDKYNAATTEEGQKAAEEAIKQIEDRQAVFEKLYSRYDTLWSKDIPDTEKALKEVQDRLEDIAEEARKARREAAQELADLRDTMRDTEKTYNNLFGEHPTLDFNISMRGVDDILGSEALDAELEKNINDYKNRLSKATSQDMKNWYNEQIAALKRVQQEGGTSMLAYNQQRMDEALRMWEEWQNTGHYTLDGQVSYNEQALHDIMKEVVEDGNDLMSDLSSAISDAMSAMEGIVEMMDDAIKNQLDGLDAVNDKIEYQQNMMEIIYGDQSSATQVQLLNLQAANEENRLKVLQEQAKIQKDITEAKRKLWEADKNNKDLARDYQDALQKERDIDGEILDTREKIAQSYKDAKEAANDLAVDNWLKNFDGQINGVNIPLEYMADQWERIKENEELYLDDLNKAYEIQKLSNKYQQLLNDATDPTIQQQITDQMREQLAYLNEKTNLSKYDVDYANAQLEILQKTIALEDARAAKNQMKLRRDSQGNYQYVYAADQNQTAEAENDLLDASMNAYNMSKEQQADVQDSYIKKVQDMADTLRKAANDATLTEEQIAAITQDIIDKGHEYLEAMGEQLNTSQQNMIMSFIDAAMQMQEEYASNVQNIAEELKEDTSRGLDDVDDRFDTSVKNWVDGETEIREESNKTRDRILNNIEDFTAAIGEANLEIADPLGEMENGVNDVDDSIVQMKDDMDDLFTLLREQSGQFGKAAKEVDDLHKSLLDANNQLSKYSSDLRSANAKVAELEATNTALRAQINGNSGGSSSGGSGANSKATGSGTTPRAEEVKPGQKYKYLGGLYYENSQGEGRTGSRGPGGTVEIAYTNWGAPYPIAVESSDSAYGWLRLDQLVKLKSGGYTGEWGADGRMAMLHEKELVLNATDTQNILAAVDAVRIITEQLKGSAFINNIGSSIGKAAQNNIQGNSIEQRVEITANFPNVNSAEEIEQALLNISDRSYQYAYNKNDIPW